MVVGIYGQSIKSKPISLEGITIKSHHRFGLDLTKRESDGMYVIELYSWTQKNTIGRLNEHPIKDEKEALEEYAKFHQQIMDKKDIVLY